MPSGIGITTSCRLSTSSGEDVLATVQGEMGRACPASGASRYRNDQDVLPPFERIRCFDSENASNRLRAFSVLKTHHPSALIFRSARSPNFNLFCRRFRHNRRIVLERCNPFLTREVIPERRISTMIPLRWRPLGRGKATRSLRKLNGTP